MPYSIVTKDGIKISDIPDDIPRDSQILKDRVIAARAKRDAASGQAAAMPGPAPDVPMITPSGQVEQIPSPPQPEQPSYSTMDYLKAAPEAALSFLTGATTGLIGEAKGFATQYGKELMGGTLGSAEAAQRIQQTAMQERQRATIAPQSPEAQQLMQNIAGASVDIPGIGKVSVSDLGALDPVIAGQLMQQMRGVQGVKRQQAAIAEEAALTPKEQAFKAAQDIGQIVTFSDVIPPQTAAQKIFQSIGEKLPFIGTGSLRRTQQEQRINNTRNLFQDAGLINLQNASDDVMEDLLQTRGSFISKYAKEKKDVIDNLSQPIYVKGVGKKGFKEDAVPVQMTNLNQYINDKLQETGVLRRAQEGDPTDIEIVKQVDAIRKSFEGKRLSDVEVARARLGTALSDSNLADSVKNDLRDKFINGMYKPVVDDMSNFIEAYGGKEDKQKWKQANRNLKENIDDLKDRAFASMLRKGEANSESITSVLLSGKTPRIEMLYKNLSPEGRKKADDLFLGNAYQMSLDKEGMVDPDRFLKFIDKNNQVLKFMDPVTRDRVTGVQRAMQLTTRAKVAATVPQTGAMNQIPALTTAASLVLGQYALPVVTGGLAIATRYGESPTRIRKAFERLGKAPKESNAEKIAFSALNAAILSEMNRLPQEQNQLPTQ